MIRPILATSAFAAALCVATAATAQPAGYYVAVPAAPATKPQLMTRATPWHLDGGAYVAARAPERDVVLCQLVARDVGQLQSFSVAGKAIDADALAKCNARAK